MKLSFESLESRAMTAVACLDPELRSLYASGMRDGFVSRPEMIELFKSSTDGYQINSTELSDLRNIVSGSAMPNDVRSLANKVLADKPTASSMGFELDKWFYGRVRPSLSGFGGIQYQPVAGNLFVNGASSSDMRQGIVGDCYLIASLGALADRYNPSVTSMFKDNADGTWGVRFYRIDGTRYVEDWVTVDRYLPVNSSGWTVFQHIGGNARDPRNELWAALAEKAYAQWARGNSYSNLSGGWPQLALSQVSGTRTYNTFDMNQVQTTLVNAVNRGDPVVIYRYLDAARTRAHAYYVQSYRNGIFYLKNPWGSQDVATDIYGIKRDCYGFAVCSRML